MAHSVAGALTHFIPIPVVSGATGASWSEAVLLVLGHTTLSFCGHHVQELLNEVGALISLWASSDVLFIFVIVWHSWTSVSSAFLTLWNSSWGSISGSLSDLGIASLPLNS